MSTTQHTGWTCSDLLAVDIRDMDARHLTQKDHYFQMANLRCQFTKSVAHLNQRLHRP